MTRVAVTKGTLRIPPTYFAVQHTERLLADEPTSFTIRTLTMALQLDDPVVRASGLDIVEVAALPLASFRRREVTMPLSFAAFERAIAAFEPEVIHQHFATWAVPAVRASRRTGAPLLVTVHGSDVFAAMRSPRAVALQGRPMLAWHRASVAQAFTQAGRVLAVSRFLADRAIEAGAQSGTVEVHYQGVDTDFFTPTRTEPGHGAEVLFVGALTRAKGVPDLVRASRAVVGRHPHRLVLIGRGPLEAEVREAGRDTPHIEVVGALNRQEVRDRLCGARVLVLPTQVNNGAREAAGLVLLEAQACGVPVITYDSGGTSEMLDPQRTGLVVAERDVDGLGDALIEFLSMSDGARSRMGADARAWVLENRSLAASARQLGELYRTISA